LLLLVKFFPRRGGVFPKIKPFIINTARRLKMLQDFPKILNTSKKWHYKAKKRR